MTVRAFDNGRPVKTGQATVTIKVQRNQFPPTFSNGPYTQTVSENVRNGTGIFTVRATDKDLQVRAGCNGTAQRRWHWQVRSYV